METSARPSKTFKKSFVFSEPDRIRIGDWGVVPNREIDFGFGCGACVCVRACEAVCGREADVSFGARASEPKFVGCRAGPGQAGPPPSRAVGVGTGPVEKVKK